MNSSKSPEVTKDRLGFPPIGGMGIRASVDRISELTSIGLDPFSHAPSAPPPPATDPTGIPDSGGIGSVLDNTAVPNRCSVIGCSVSSSWVETKLDCSDSRSGDSYSGGPTAGNAHLAMDDDCPQDSFWADPGAGIVGGIGGIGPLGFHAAMKVCCL